MPDSASVFKQKIAALHKLWALLGMAILTCFFTWPLASDPAHLLNDFGDPLLNSWILWWDVHALTTAGVSWFNAPIFYPHPNTLAFSEHLLASAVIAAPLLLAGADPVLAHNFIFGLSFVLSAWGAYLLAYELTESKGAAVLAGLAFGFSCFRFGQLGHVQILSTHFMPFILLYLHRWTKKASWGLAMAWGLFWLLQILSCGYHALFISLAVGLFLLFYGVTAQWWKKAVAWVQLLAIIIIFSSVLIPLYQPYSHLKEQMGFVRDLPQTEYFSATPTSYLAANPANNLYGQSTAVFRKPEGELFLGVGLTALVLWGFILPGRPRNYSNGFSQSFPAVGWFLLIMGAMVFLLKGGRSYAWLLVPWGMALLGWICSFELARKDSMASVAGSRLLSSVGNVFRTGWAKRAPISKDQIFYLLLAVLAFWASLGPRAGLYTFFYKLFPGFDIIRVPARFAVLVTLAWAILAAFGYCRLKTSTNLKGGIKVLWLLLALLVAAEFYSVPLKMYPVSNNTPAVYVWLEKQPKSIIMELPALGFGSDLSRDTRYLYWSVKHHHILVNGYSGFFPKDYEKLATQLNYRQGHFMDQLRARDVRFLILHVRHFHPSLREGLVEAWQQTPGLRQVYADQWDYVFEISDNH